MSTDLRFLVWKEPSKKPKSFFLDNCDKIEAGLCAPELQRQSLLFSAASDNLAFAVFMKDGRRLCLEAPTPILRDEWMASLDALVTYRRALNKLTVKAEDNESPFNEAKDENSFFG